MNGLRPFVWVVMLLALAVSTAFGVFATPTNEVTAEFSSTFNLFTGSRVRVAGVNVGRIARIDVPEGSATVRVTMAIDRGVRLPADVRAVIVPQALLGERYVQLHPPHRQGDPTLAWGTTIPVERTGVPADFDEVLDSLNRYLDALPEDEVARLVTNLATVLDGQGDELGRTLDNAKVAIDVLRDNDDELIALAGRLADLNETLNTRNEQLGAFIDDANAVVASLAGERRQIDAALGGVARMTTELADLLATHRGSLEQDVATVTRLGRTAVRNLDEIERSVTWQAELYENAGRVFDMERNWLPLVNNYEGLSELIAERVTDRLVGLCLRLEVAECSTPELVDGHMPERVCVAPILPCGHVAHPDQTVPLEEALDQVLNATPGLRERLEDDARDPRQLLDHAQSTLPPAPAPVHEPRHRPPLSRRGLQP
ncbi:MAG: MCE family protein [Actinobacteria bacterium]|nr:MCE family protein [Actinomycetota bacterium]